MPLSVDLLARTPRLCLRRLRHAVRRACGGGAACGGGRTEAARLSEIWRAKQLEYSWVLSLAGRYEPFWTLTERALDYAFARCPSVDRRVQRPALLEAYRTLDAYPEAAEVLAGAAQARLSHRNPLERQPRLCSRAPSPSAGLARLLDHVLSADAVGVFKTSPRTYALITEAFGVDPAEVVLVASNRWDAAGATAFGFRSVWVNRAGLPDE